MREDGSSVQWIPVEEGFQSGDFVQLVKPPLAGKVVTLGQQFIKDGTPVRIAGETSLRTGGAESR